MGSKKHRDESRRNGSRSIRVGLAIGLCALAMVCVGPDRLVGRDNTAAEKPPAGQAQLQAVGLATHNNAANNDGLLPLAVSSTPDGNPLHSWRTAVLPWMDRAALHAAIDFSESWDSETNAFLRVDCPDEFQVPGSPESRTSFASFFAITGPDTPFPVNRRVSFDQLGSGDGASSTLMFVEAAGMEIEWAEPRDIPFAALSASPEALRGKGPSSHRPNGDVLVLFCDGRSGLLSGKTDPAVLRAIATWNGEEPISLDDF
ncbi:MAG: hypothetical protein CMJ47_07130 [Planctomyces sp.]|nr:hypothetical protein [Planctomyces sp.]